MSKLRVNTLETIDGSYAVDVADLSLATTVVEDNLTSTNVTSALSANQGRVLKGLVDGFASATIDDNLTSTSTTHALSANQGRVLKGLIDAIPGAVVDDNLTSTSTTNALSANQGRVLKGLVDSAGTVSSVSMTVPTGLSVSGSPVTTTGTFAVVLASGYSIPTISNQSNWSTAYGWGNHASAGYATLNGTQTLSNKTITGLRETKTAMAANNIDLSTGNVFTKTISGATTLTVSNAPDAGTTGSFILDLTNGGSAVITWWTGVKWAGGTAPTLTATGRDVLGFFTHDGGTTWTGLLLGKDVK